MANLRLVGSKLTNVSANRNDDFSGKLTMKNNIKIDSLEKLREPKETVKVKYTFEIDYGELGGINIAGNLFLTGDQKSVKDLLKAEKDKKYESNEYMAITNLIIQKASIKAFELEEELGLPIHIKLPSLSSKNKQ